VGSVLGQDIENINLANEYYQNGELEKAKELYDKLSKNTSNVALIHNNYFDLLLIQGDFDQATKYIDRRIKENPGNNFFLVDKGLILKRKGEREQESDYFKKLIKDISTDEYQTRLVAQYFIKKQMFDYAQQVYILSRSVLNNPDLYALELANIFRILNNKDQMILEYLNFANQNPENINYIKNILQSSLIEKSDLEKIEQILIERIQKDPDNKTYADLLIWVNVQERNFYGAFIQARAYDRRFDKDGNKLLEVGFLSLDNKAYNDAVQIFDYLCNNYKDTYLYPIAKRYKIQSREELVKNTYPVNLGEIRKLANDYENLTQELGIGPSVAEAMLNKAHLHAFYLNEIDSAIDILNRIVKIPKISPDLVARCKLDLGDIYILAGQSWESALLYAQVEKSRKDSPLGYEAKLKNAKLSYYKGDFLLAQEQLDVLKLATSREIANDAMQLSIFIRNNTALDTSDFLLRKYANVELMLFQNKKKEALDSLNFIYSRYHGSSLDEYVLWQIASIQIEMGNYKEAVEYLQKITKNFDSDVLGDDAMYRTAEVYQFFLIDIEKAKQIYRDFLTKYPGSLYTSEARKRYRMLRGDALNDL
jgi:tetratricopeptide (TPR) repeat protein